MTKHKQLALLLLVGLLGPLQQSANGQQTLRPRLATTFCYPRPTDWGWEMMCSIEFDNGMSIPDATSQTWSPDGVRIAYAGVGGVHVKDRSTGTTTVILPMDLSLLSWSPNGARIAGLGWVGDAIEGTRELFTVAPDGSGLSRLTNSVGFESSYAWSPSGAAIAFGRAVGGIHELFVMRADGSNAFQLTSDVGFRNGAISWSPDGARIAFNCGTTVCAVNADGTNLVPLLTSTGVAVNPAFGPNGQVAFLRPGSQGYFELVVEDRNGSVRYLAPGINAAWPRWSPDGGKIAFVREAVWYGGACNADGSPCIPPDETLVVNADSSGLGLAAYGGNPTWSTPQPGQPSAAFTFTCGAQGCHFDSSVSFDPDGAIASYGWVFGDGTTASGPAPTHTYATGGWYDVALTVTDNAGARDVFEARVLANAAPTASLAVTCNGARCTFDASASVDPDGTVTRYGWNFGDGTGVWWTDQPIVSSVYNTGTYTASLVVTDNVNQSSNTVQHTLMVVNDPPAASFTVICVELRCRFDGSSSFDTETAIFSFRWSFGDGTNHVNSSPGVTYEYVKPGTYTATLTVVDSAQQASSTRQTITVTAPPPPPPVPIHVGDLDGSTYNGKKTWHAYVTLEVHTAAHEAVEIVTVTGSWSDGTSGSCTTDFWGHCLIQNVDIPRKSAAITFTVTSVVRASFVYGAAGNHDGDGDSTGTRITIRRP